MARHTKLDPDGLTQLQRRFVEEYPVDMVGKQALIRAGWKGKISNADKHASQLLGNPRVRKVLDRVIKERSEKTGVTARWVLEQMRAEYDRLMTLNTMDMNQIMNPDFSFKPFDQWPPILRQRQTIRALKLHELFKLDPKTRRQVLVARMQDIVQQDLKTLEQKILETIGKHVNVGAFKEQFEHVGEVTLRVEYVEPEKMNEEQEEE